jgi:hypothetical protein
MGRRGSLSLEHWALCIAVAALAATACGKKGPPLPPLVHIPAAVDRIAAQRAGSDVYVTLTVPAENIDRSKPADVSRIDVYAVTATAPPATGQFLAQASRIAQIPVAPMPSPDEAGAAEPAPSSMSSPQSGAVQGMAVTIHEVLSPDALTPVAPLPPTSRRGTPAAPSMPITTAAPTVPAGPPMPRRFYMAIGFSDRARSGPPGQVADLPLSVIPPAPAAVALTYTADAVQLAWLPSGGVLGYLLDRALPIEPPPFDDIVVPPPPGPLASDVPAGPTRYNVYRDEARDPLSLPEPAPPAWQAARPQPLNAAPLTELSFSDLVDFDRTQCYTVRAVRGAAPALVEGDPAPRRCITAVDIFPPAPPANVTAVASEGSIGLIWEPNAELDLGGYVVLRGEAGSATLQPLTDRPIAEPRFTDRTVQAGTRYVYAVVAVDDRVPVPNMSAESARVEETAR